MVVGIVTEAEIIALAAVNHGRAHQKKRIVMGLSMRRPQPSPKRPTAGMTVKSIETEYHYCCLRCHLRRNRLYIMPPATARGARPEARGQLRARGKFRNRRLPPPPAAACCRRRPPTAAAAGCRRYLPPLPTPIARHRVGSARGGGVRGPAAGRATELELIGILASLSKLSAPSPSFSVSSSPPPLPPSQLPPLPLRPHTPRPRPAPARAPLLV